MNIFMTKSFKTVITACIIAFSTQAYSVFAENQNTLQPYHIEMIIFERTSAAYSPPEYWPQDVILTYPPNYRVILTQEESLALASNEPALNAEINAEGNYQVNEQATKEENSPITQAAQNTQTPAAISQRILFKRPNNSYVLTREANAINRKSTMRVLFHKAWQQTLDNTAKAPSVIINGGDTFDSRTELGGSIRFSVNKFIHVDTQLWLARFTPNYGQELNWPIPPIAPTAINTQRTTFDTLNLEDTLHFKPDTQDFGITTQAATSALNYLNTTHSNPTHSNPTHSNPTHSNPTYSNQEVVSNNTYSGTIGLQHHLGNSLLASQPQTSLNYLTSEVITLKQSRRMRSKELHYIDHPRLGILIKVIPIALDDTQGGL